MFSVTFLLILLTDQSCNFSKKILSAAVCRAQFLDARVNLLGQIQHIQLQVFLL